MRRVLIGLLFVVLITGAVAGYMFMSEGKQKQAQCKQQIENINFEHARSSAARGQELAQLKVNNQALVTQNDQLVEKFKSTFTQAQQLLDSLQKENPQLLHSNQFLKARSERKINSLARDLKNIQNEQLALKQQYADKTAECLAQSKAMPVTHSKSKAVSSQPKPAHSSVVEKPSVAPQIQDKNGDLSLSFPAPGSAAARKDELMNDNAANVSSSSEDD